MDVKIISFSLLILALRVLHVQSTALHCCDAEIVLKDEHVCGDGQNITLKRCEGRNLMLNPSDEFGIDEHYDILVTKEFQVDPNNYCVHYIIQGTNVVQTAVFCEEGVMKYRSVLKKELELYNPPEPVIVRYISIFCFFLTIAVYCTLSQLRNVQGTCIVHVCFNWMMTYVLREDIFHTHTNDLIRSIASNLVLYLYYTTFLWDSILIFKTWKMARNVNVYEKLQKNSSRREFWLYFSIGYGMPLVVTAVIVTLNYLTDMFPDNVAIASTSFFFHLYVKLTMYVIYALQLLMVVNTFTKLWGLPRQKQNCLATLIKELWLLMRLLVMSNIYRVAYITAASIWADQVILKGRIPWNVVLSVRIANNIHGIATFIFLTATRLRIWKILGKYKLFRCCSVCANVPRQKICERPFERRYVCNQLDEEVSL